VNTERNPFLRHRFETDERFYCIESCYDLFGQLVVVRTWGGKFNQQGARKTVPVNSLAEANALIEQLSQERIKRGYRCVDTKLG
jgi:predicted DNA-binding WGR domain protein